MTAKPDNIPEGDFANYFCAFALHLLISSYGTETYVRSRCRRYIWLPVPSKGASRNPAAAGVCSVALLVS